MLERVEVRSDDIELIQAAKALQLWTRPRALLTRRDCPASCDGWTGCFIAKRLSEWAERTESLRARYVKLTETAKPATVRP